MVSKEEIQEIEDYCRKLDFANGINGPNKDELSLLACIGLLLVELVRQREPAQPPEKKK